MVHVGSGFKCFPFGDDNVVVTADDFVILKKDVFVGDETLAIQIRFVHRHLQKLF